VILERIDSRREEGSGILIDLYELREGPDGTPVHDLERIEQILDSVPFQRAMEQMGPTARATITGPPGAGVLEIRVHFDHHRDERGRIELG